MRRFITTSVLCMAISVGWNAFSCTLVPRFHQVTVLRGRVVGKKLGVFQFRWLRQSFGVSDADLSLYEYHPTVKFTDIKQIAAVQADAHGRFDFGKVPIGQYALHVASKGSRSLDDWFDVEIIDTVKRTDSVLIDVSPIHPDCKGGHEFIEKKT